MDDIIVTIKDFLAARQEAEARGAQDFTCPICGGNARWVRAPENNHLHCACKECGIKIME